MTYAAPKTDWEPNDDILDTDFNRIETNTVHLRNSIFTMASHEKNIAIAANPHPAEIRWLSLQKMVAYLYSGQTMRLIRSCISHSIIFSNPYNLTIIPYLRISPISLWVVNNTPLYEEALFPFSLDNAELITNSDSVDNWYLIEVLLRINATIYEAQTLAWASWSLRFDLQN